MKHLLLAVVVVLNVGCAGMTPGQTVGVAVGAAVVTALMISAQDDDEDEAPPPSGCIVRGNTCAN